MTWMYRVMRERWQFGKEWGYSYGVHEVYGGAWTQESMELRGDTLAALKSDYEQMAEAFKLPVLDYETGKPIKGAK